MVDKNIIWEYVNSLTTADQLHKVHRRVDLKANDGNKDMTINSCSGYLDMRANTNDMLYYCMVVVTDAGGSMPWSDTSLNGKTDAQLQQYVNDNRDRVWMTMGGYLRAGGSEDSPAIRVEFDAKSKRALMPGEKLQLILMSRNSALNTAAYYTCAIDFIVFYSS